MNFSITLGLFVEYFHWSGEGDLSVPQVHLILRNESIVGE